MKIRGSPYDEVRVEKACTDSGRHVVNFKESIVEVLRGRFLGWTFLLEETREFRGKDLDVSYGAKGLNLDRLKGESNQEN